MNICYILNKKYLEIVAVRCTKTIKHFMKNLKNIVMKKYIAIFLSMLMAFFSNAQIEGQDIDIIKELAQEEQEIIEALVLYPKEIRELIFEASTHPEVIIKLANVQSRTSEQFKTLLMKYPIEAQKAVWEMTRYPNLIGQLAEQPENSEEILKQYPEEVHEYSRTAIKDQFSLLQEVDRLDKLSQYSFKSIIDPLPEESKKVFNELIQYPEILVLLNQNIELTILGGDFYKKAPELVRRHADSLNMVVARQQAIELENWKNQLENDPEALEELQQATQEFSDEYDYDEANITEGKEQEVIDDLYYDDEEYDYDEEEIRTVEYHYYHYPYWFGYPYWYAYPRWRPYPFWYEWGYYWTPYGSVVVYHMPSPFFMHWYFYNPYHHYRYTHLSNHCINHYYGHRSSGSSVVGAVKSWRTTNREVVKENWLENETKRIPALKEFGKMEEARITYNEKHPTGVVSEKEYLQKHENKYPNLSNSVESKIPKTKVPTQKIEPQKPIPRDTDIKGKTPKKQMPVVPQKPLRKEKPIIRLKKAEDYHKDTWRRSTTRPSVPSKPRVVPRKPATVPKTSPPKSKSPRTPRDKKN